MEQVSKSGQTCGLRPGLRLTVHPPTLFGPADVSFQFRYTVHLTSTKHSTIRSSPALETERSYIGILTSQALNMVKKWISCFPYTYIRQSVETRIKEHTRAVNKLAISPFLPYLFASGSQDGHLRLWVCSHPLHIIHATNFLPYSRISAHHLLQL